MKCSLIRHDPNAKIARMKDGTTHLTGVIVAAPIHPADDGDTTTLPGTLEAAARNLAEVGLAPTLDEPCALVGDKGYHSRERLKELGRRRVENPDRGTQAGSRISALAR